MDKIYHVRLGPDAQRQLERLAGTTGKKEMENTVLSRLCTLALANDDLRRQVRDQASD